MHKQSGQKKTTRAKDKYENDGTKERQKKRRNEDEANGTRAGIPFHKTKLPSARERETREKHLRLQTSVPSLSSQLIRPIIISVSFLIQTTPSLALHHLYPRSEMIYYSLYLLNYLLFTIFFKPFTIHYISETFHPSLSR